MICNVHFHHLYTTYSKPEIKTAEMASDIGHYYYYSRVTDESQTTTDKSQATTDESQATIDESQATIDESQTRNRRVTGDYRRVTDKKQTSHRRLQKNHRRIQMSHRLLQATRTTEVYFQPLTWFNKFICRPSDICYYAI